MRKLMVAVPASLALTLVTTSCGREKDVSSYDRLAKHVLGNRVGSDADQWIEMENMTGEWERTGLIFGYNGDYGECVKAIEGLKRTNFARKYRCVPAN